MGGVAVSPEIFDKVFFQHAEVLASVEAAIDLVAGAAGLGDIEIQIDENVQTNRVSVSGSSPVVFQIQSGAMEDTTKPRTFSDLQTKINVARLLYEALDRADDSFGAPPIGGEISTQARGAWDIYCFGRVARLGLRMHQPRYLYNFHNWVGFSDDATAVFEELWNGSALSFPDLETKVALLEPTRTI